MFLSAGRKVVMEVEVEGRRFGGGPSTSGDAETPG